MQSEKLSYPGIGGAVAGVVGVLGVFLSWFEISGPNGSIRIDGTADSSGQLAFAMSIALFAFSVGYVLLDDRRIRRSMAALIIASAVILVLACLLGLTSAGEGTDLAPGFSLSVLGGLLGVGAGILTLKDAPVGEVMPDEADTSPEASSSTDTEAPAAV
jgi:drug/metabolite transporter (DMT)-like permease